MIVLWLATGVIAKPTGVEPPPAPSIGFSMWSGEKPSWEKRRERVLKEIEAQTSAKKAPKKASVSPLIERKEPFTPPLTFSPDWGRLGLLFRSYGAFLRPNITAFDAFLEARNKAKQTAPL